MAYENDEKMNTHKIDDLGERKLLANFMARITKETRYDDGYSKKTVVTVSGWQEDEQFPDVEIPAEKFLSMSWVLPEWGVSAVIQPGNAAKEDLRTEIQLNSKPKKETIYTHTGWAKIGKEYRFLHSSGAIHANGNDTTQRVLLPHELRKFKLSTDDKQLPNAIRASIALRNLGPKEILWPIICAAYAPALGPVDFGIHLAGRTGTFKSEVSSLIQSHYGSEMDARALPGSWSSTANALEAQAFKAKNAVFVVDDFVPTGSSWQIKALQKTADQLLRGQGNQSGRARLTDTSNLQQTMYPRGIIFSTGEDTPEGHSIRGRMLILELTPGDISTTELTKSQEHRKLLEIAMGGFIQYVAPTMQETAKRRKRQAIEIRDTYVDIGHTRTPMTIGYLIASGLEFLQFAVAKAAINKEQHKALKQEMWESILAAAGKQDQYLQQADPVEAFNESIRHILGAYVGHLRTKDGGIPKEPTSVGWTSETSHGDLPTYKSHGKCIGWIDWDEDEILIDITAAYSDIKRHSNGLIAYTKPTMLKRLKDAGQLTRVDEQRKRNTVRITCEGHIRQALAMSASSVLDRQEVPNA